MRETLSLPISVDLEGELHGLDEQDSVRIMGTSGASLDPQAKMVYFAQPDGSLELTWKVWTEVQTTALSSYVRAQRDAAEIVGVVDYVDRATYEVL